jgi:AraC-like DNA-binding protein
MTITTRHAEVDRKFQDFFDIRYCSNPENIEEELEGNSVVAICIEFDYPDRPGMALLCEIKERHPRIPILMLTMQHSERLAVWAYRNRVLDYLVTPVSEEDFLRCTGLLQAVQTAEDRQGSRTSVERKAIIPVEIPSGQRTGGVRLATAVHFVKRNFRGKIRNADIAARCGMSSYHFSHAFTETFSLTFQEFVLRYRIFEACKELQHPNVPVTNVAFSVGFNDPSYFSRMFRRFVGLSPSEFSGQICSDEIDQRIRDLANSLDLPELKLMKVEPQRAVIDGKRRALVK